MDRSISASFCAALVDEWLRAGVDTSFLPGDALDSPIGRALAERSEMQVRRCDTEATASLAAYGYGLHSGAPAVTTSAPTAAKAEAARSGVPMLTLEASDPIELLNTPTIWRSQASRWVLEATGWSGSSGPVEVTVPAVDLPVAREAHVPDRLPAGRPDGRPWHGNSLPTTAIVADTPELIGRRGVIITGRQTGGPNAVLSLADTLGWPVLADHGSRCRAPGSISHFDSLLRVPEFATAARPEVILRFGEPLRSQPLHDWIAASGAEVISAVPNQQWLDSDDISNVVINDSRAVLSFLAAAEGVDSESRVQMREFDPWRAADIVAADAIAQHLETEVNLTSPGLVREVSAGAISDTALVLGSSELVEDLETFGPVREDIAVYNGDIAGGRALAVAYGVATSGVPTTCILDGLNAADNAQLDDLAEQQVDLTIIVIGDVSASDQANHRVPVTNWGEPQAESRVRVVSAPSSDKPQADVRTELHAAVAAAIR